MPPETSTFDRLAAACGLPRLEARILLSLASGRTREWLIAHGPEPAARDCADRFEALAARRRAGEPIAYLAGQREFHGLGFAVDAAVLIPRPETELLVDQVLAQAPPSARVADLGTGSGAIAIALVHARADLRVVATDRSTAALSIAIRNAQALLGDEASARIDWRTGSWWSAIGVTERFDIIVSNPPYIAEGDPHLDTGDLRFEPREALASGPDGLADLREIIAGAPGHLTDEGALLVEHGWDQGAAVRNLMHVAGFTAIQTLPDLAQHERITRGVRTSQPGRAPNPGLE